LSVFIYVFLFIFLYKLIINSYKYYRCKILYEKYIKWLHSDYLYSIEDTAPEVRDLLKDYSENFIPIVEPAGFGIVNSMKIHVLSQYPSKSYDFAAAQINLFEKAISQYAYNARQVLNPIYWIELIIWLPKNIISFLGIDTKLKTVKVLYIPLQIIYWTYGIIKFLGLKINPIFLQIFTN